MLDFLFSSKIFRQTYQSDEYVSKDIVTKKTKIQCFFFSLMVQNYKRMHKIFSTVLGDNVENLFIIIIIIHLVTYVSFFFLRL